MLGWLRRTAGRASELAGEFSANRAVIAALLDLPEAEMPAEAQRRLAAMDEGELPRFIVAVATASAGALITVQRLAPRYATQHRRLRPATLPTESRARAAVERHYRLETLAALVYDPAEPDRPAPVVEATPVTRADLPGEIAAHLREFQERLRDGGGWKASQGVLDEQLTSLQERVVPEDRGQEVNLLLCRAALEGYRIGRPHHPPEFAHMIRALEGIFAATVRAGEASDGPEVRDIGISSEFRRHFQTLDSLFIDQVWFGKRLTDDPYATLLAFHFREVGRALLAGADLLDIGASQDVDVHRSLFDRYTSAMLMFTDHDIDADGLRTIEQNVFRTLALDTRSWLRRDHVFLTEPSLPMPPVHVDPNTIFYSGGEQVRTTLERAGTIQGLRLSEPRRHDNPTHARWNQLRGSHVAVFDFTSYVHLDDDGPLDRSRPDAGLADAAPVAAVAYELGWARALGTPILVVERPGRPAPFDVDVEPVRIQDAETDHPKFLEALWRALYVPQQEGVGTCVADTIRHVRQHYAEHPVGAVRAAAQHILTADYTRNTMKLHDALEGLVAQLGPTAPAILTPTFPGRYPDAPTLFFAGAFREWALPAQDAARSVCRDAAMTFWIGHERVQQDIVRAIWDDLSAATHVVVDITNLNPNALQELGMAQAIGRATLIITQNRAPHDHLPAIAKMRTHHYDPADPRSMAALHTLLTTFCTA